MKNPFIPCGLLVSACTLLSPFSASAASNYDEVVVTGTRTPVALEDSLASVTAISREDLETRQPLDLMDVFRQTPSLDISRSGGPGAVTSLFTRGTASGHTLFLVDGQRVSSATLGSTSFQFINPDQIERIEVVRGARSALYGSEAIGGVIQVFTRDGSTSEGSYVTTATGSNDMHKVAAGSSGNHGNWRYGVHTSYLETDGIDNLEADTGFNRDRDGYRNKSANASLGYRFNNGADLALRYLSSNSRAEHDNAFDPASRPYSDSRLESINLSGRMPITDFWESQLSLGTSLDDSDNYDGATGLNIGNFRTERQQLFWQNDMTVADGHILTLGYDYYDDKVVSTSNQYTDVNGAPVKSRNNSAVFGQFQGSWSVFDLVTGLRHDDNEEFGTHTSGNIAVGVNLNEHHKVVASWSEGFKAPTFNDLYWPASTYSAGNPNLKPETSQNQELSVRGHYTAWQWSLSYFENDVDNLISWAPGTDFVWRPYNVNNAEITGAEFSVAAVLMGWHIDAAYSYVEPRDAETHHLLIMRSRSNLIINASRDFDALHLGLSFKTQDRRFTDTANTDVLGGYSNIGVQLGYKITQNVEAQLKVENLFDKDYQLNTGYNQPGREWQLGLSYSL